MWGQQQTQAARGSAGPSDEELRALLRSQLVGGGGGSGQQQQPLFGASSAPGRSQQQRNALWPELPPELAGYEGVFFGGGSGVSASSAPFSTSAPLSSRNNAPSPPPSSSDAAALAAQSALYQSVSWNRATSPPPLPKQHFHETPTTTLQASGWNSHATSMASRGGGGKNSNEEDDDVQNALAEVAAATAAWQAASGAGLDAAFAARLSFESTTASNAGRSPSSFDVGGSRSSVDSQLQTMMGVGGDGRMSLESHAAAAGAPRDSISSARSSLEEAFSLGRGHFGGGGGGGGAGSFLSEQQHEPPTSPRAASFQQQRGATSLDSFLPAGYFQGQQLQMQQQMRHQQEMERRAAFDAGEWQRRAAEGVSSSPSAWQPQQQPQQQQRQPSLDLASVFGSSLFSSRSAPGSPAEEEEEGRGGGLGAQQQQQQQRRQQQWQTNNGDGAAFAGNSRRPSSSAASLPPRAPTSFTAA